MIMYYYTDKPKKLSVPFAILEVQRSAKILNFRYCVSK